MAAWEPEDPIRFREDYLNGATNDELVAWNQSTLNKVLKYIKREQDSGNLPRRISTSITRSAMPRYNQHWKLSGDFIIAGDFHAPCYSKIWCDRILALSERFGIKRLIVGGDGLDMGAFSGWGPNVDVPWEKESLITAGWLWKLYHHFDEIWWLRGNHCKRVRRKTDGQIGFQDLLPSILCRYATHTNQVFTFDPARLRMSDYPFCEIDGEWRVVHPKQYSKIPLRIPNSLALKYRKHIISLHGHHAAKGWCDDGKHIVIECGGVFDEETVQYVMTEMTNHPAWNPGFAIYQDGCAELYCSEPWAKWR
jgi:hypothetical protein